MNFLISVIVPVYNTEKYLERCVESILKQTYTNLEIILVDDGSTDGSGKICDEYRKKDGRIVVIHKPNGGQSSARNAGIDSARGDYIGFIDSDDCVSPSMYEKLLSIMMENEVKVSGVNGVSFTFDEDLNAIDEAETPTAVCTYSEYAVGLLKRTSNSSVCSKLFSIELFQKRRFAVGKLNEDALLLFYLFMEEKCDYAYTDAPYYYYYNREGSVCRQKFGNVYFSLVENNLEIEEYAKTNSLPIIKEANDAVLYACAMYIIAIPHTRFVQNESFTRFVVDEIKKRKKAILRSNLVTRDRFVLWLFSKFPRITKWAIDRIRKNR